MTELNPLNYNARYELLCIKISLICRKYNLMLYLSNVFVIYINSLENKI